MAYQVCASGQNLHTAGVEPELVLKSPVLLPDLQPTGVETLLMLNPLVRLHQAKKSNIEATLVSLVNNIRLRFKRSKNCALS